MKKKIYLFLAFFGLLGLLSGCEKDETRVYLLENPVAPSLVTVPSLALERTNGNDILEFIGTPVDPGFVASATYFLEACAHGNNFADVVTLYSGKQDTSIKLKVMEINSAFLKILPSDAVTNADLRLRAVLTVDAGTGAPGTGDNLFSYASATQSKDVTTYGLPRLDLVGSGLTQKIESALGDGIYIGFVKLDATQPFTLLNPDSGTSYGGTGDVLSVDGTAIPVTETGWYKLTANVNTLTYTLKLFNVGMIGSATPNGWSAPDSKMTYNPASGYWEITLDLIVGAYKFRINDSWDQGINLGLGDDDHPEYTKDNLWNNGSSKDIALGAAGNYTVKLSIGETKYSYTITKNN